MDEKLVPDCNQILSTLLKGDIHVNGIIQETSLPKKRALVANDFLEDIQMINKTKHTTHKQKILVSLTDFGNYFAKLIVNFEKFDGYLKDMDVVVKQFNNYSHSDENVRRNILLDRKWNNEDIDNYESHLEYVNDLEIDFLDIMTNIIEHVYAYTLLKFTPSKEAKDYMNIVFSNKLIQYLQNKIEKTISMDIQTATCKKCNSNTTQQIPVEDKINELYREMSDRLFESVDDNMKFLLNHTLISKELKKLIDSTVDVMSLPKKFIDQKIKDMEEPPIEVSEEEENRIYIENIKPLKSLYESLLQRI